MRPSTIKYATRKQYAEHYHLGPGQEHKQTRRDQEQKQHNVSISMYNLTKCFVRTHTCKTRCIAEPPTKKHTDYVDHFHGSSKQTGDHYDLEELTV
jgi:hypothetical protein